MNFAYNQWNMCELITTVVIAQNKYSTEIFAPCDWDLILMKLMTDGTDLLCSVNSVTLITVRKWILRK